MYYQSFYPYQPFQSFQDESEISRATKNMDSRFFGIEEGFLAGNIVRSEYLPYKNFRIPKLNPKNERESKLFNLLALYDYSHDLNLILDVFPTDKEALALFMEVNNQYKKAREEYVKQYGPLMAEDARDENGTFNYITTPSPWISR